MHIFNHNEWIEQQQTGCHHLWGDIQVASDKMDKFCKTLDYVHMYVNNVGFANAIF